MEIRENQTLELRNVLSFRAKMTQQALAMKSQEIERLLRESGAQRTATPVTATFAVEPGPQGPVMDVEILLAKATR